LVTPLQMSALTVFVANGGTFFKPYLVKEIKSGDGQVQSIIGPQ